ncbi:MAG: CHAT domain-containing protein [Saprospiraceae bacterium]|nr:CHAT domain-containing protein [Saprospiraceae bacterium]
MTCKPFCENIKISSKLLLALFIGVSSFQYLASDLSRMDAAECQVEDAVALMKTGAYEEALPLLKKALAIFEKTKADEQYLNACKKLEVCFYELKTPNGEIIRFFSDALKKIKGFKNEQVIKAFFYSYIASYYYFDNRELAIANYEEGLPIAESIKDTNLLSAYYSNLGRLYWDTGNHDRGLVLQLKAAHFFTLQKDSANLATVLYYIGDTYRNKKDFISLDYFRQSLGIDPLNPQAWIQYSKAYQDFGNLDSALIVLAEAKSLIGNDAIAKADFYYQYARLYKDKGNIPKAASTIEYALAFAKEGYDPDDVEFARIQNLAGKIYLASNNPDKALTWFHNNLLRQSKGASEDMDLTQNPALEQLSSGSYWVLGSLDGKGEAFYQKYLKTKDKKHLEYALAAFKLALSYGENMRLSYGHESSKTDLYEYLNPAVEGGIKAAMAMASETGNPTWHETAFAFAERVKAAVMAEALYGKDLIKQLIPDSLLDQKNDLQERIAALEIQLQSEPDSAYQDTLLETKLLLTKFENELETNYPRYKTLKYGFQKTVDLVKIREQLAEDALLVEYFKGDATLYTFALSKTTFKAYTTPITDDFEATLLQYRRALSDWHYIRDSGKLAEQDFITTAPKLYQWLLARPLAEFGAKSLVIVPDGALGLISFDALLTAPFQSDWTDPAIPYLIKKYPISYDWSAGAMVSRTRKAPQTEYHFGGFGTQYEDDPQPIAMRSDLGPLPNADDEVRDIDALLDGASWLNAEATKDRFLNYAPQCGILHIATHGILDEEDPMQSHLVFNKTGDGGENRLFASELYNMDLHAQMAVLSACNTASGKVAAGEGNMSIARAFAYAGCPTLVSNLWSANDLASAKLMALFYRHLKAGVPVDEALRAAKLSYLETEPGSVSLPYYWASFMVVGEPAALLFPSFNRWLLAGGLLLGVGLLYFLFKRFVKSLTAQK